MLPSGLLTCIIPWCTGVWVYRERVIRSGVLMVYYEAGVSTLVALHPKYDILIVLSNNDWCLDECNWHTFIKQMLLLKLKSLLSQCTPCWLLFNTCFLSAPESSSQLNVIPPQSKGWLWIASLPTAKQVIIIIYPCSSFPPSRFKCSQLFATKDQCCSLYKLPWLGN